VARRFTTCRGRFRRASVCGPGRWPVIARSGARAKPPLESYRATKNCILLRSHVWHPLPGPFEFFPLHIERKAQVVWTAWAFLWFRRCRFRLKSKPQRELEDSWISRARDLAKREIDYPCVRVAELSVVEDVKRFQSKLRLHVLADR
jgi:hypothetical protein